MRPRALPLILFVFGAACDGLHITTIPPEDRPLPEDVAAAYREDAARLALRHLATTTDLALAPAEIPESLRATLYNALARVHNAQIAARDEVAGIHTFPDPQLRRLYVQLDPTHEWTQAWQQGERLTGNAEVDALLERYELDVERYYDWSIGTYVVLVATGEPLNLKRVARAFAAVAGVLYAQPDAVCCDGSDITAAPVSGGWGLTYHFRWGDCPAGCIEEHWWRFTILADGIVRYQGEGGSEPPRRW